ncbi:MAG: hypothetical protein ACI9AR_000266 [Flavobacteriaceae bacterium]|jgi:hypothetical protein
MRKFQDIKPMSNIESKKIKQTPVVENKPKITKKIEKETPNQDNFYPMKDISSPVIHEYSNDIQNEIIQEKEKGSKGLGVIALVCIVALTFTILLAFSGASIKVDPKVDSVELNTTFTAIKDTTRDGMLPFHTMSISVTKEIPLESNQEATQVEEKAKGEVIIYNAHSTSSLNLREETRLVTPEGLIFKTKKSITIPGKKGVGDKAVPGSLTVEVTAEKAGTDYNISLSDFKLVGFVGTSREDTIYARNESDFTGGYSGLSYSLPEEKEESLKEQLNIVLKEALMEKVSAEKPNTFITFPDTYFFDIQESYFLEDSIGNPRLSQEGNLTVFLFNTNQLNEAVRNKLFNEETEKGDIFMDSYDDISLTLASRITIDPQSTEQVSFTLSGSANAVWNINNEELIQLLVGKKRKEFDRILSRISNISNASAEVRPFWSSRFPLKQKNIKIINNRQILEK